MEIAILVALIVALGVLAVWSSMQRPLREHNRQMAKDILHQAVQVDEARGAAVMLGLAGTNTDAFPSSFADLTPFLKAGQRRDAAGHKDWVERHTSEGRDWLGNAFVIRPGKLPRVNPITQSNLLSVTGGPAFWGPYS